MGGVLFFCVSVEKTMTTASGEFTGRFITVYIVKNTGKILLAIFFYRSSAFGFSQSYSFINIAPTVL